MKNSKYNNDKNLYRDKIVDVSKIKQKIYRTVAFSELEIAINRNSYIDIKNFLITLKRRLLSRTVDCRYKIQKKYQNLQKIFKQNLDQ